MTEIKNQPDLCLGDAGEQSVMFTDTGSKIEIKSEEII